jgi:hypothetical protein
VNFDLLSLGIGGICGFFGGGFFAIFMLGIAFLKLWSLRQKVRDLNIELACGTSEEAKQALVDLTEASVAVIKAYADEDSRSLLKLRNATRPFLLGDEYDNAS